MTMADFQTRLEELEYELSRVEATFGEIASGQSAFGSACFPAAAPLSHEGFWPFELRHLAVPHRIPLVSAAFESRVCQ
jgi:hypothetical protein